MLREPDKDAAVKAINPAAPGSGRAASVWIILDGAGAKYR